MPHCHSHRAARLRRQRALRRGYLVRRTAAACDEGASSLVGGVDPDSALPIGGVTAVCGFDARTPNIASADRADPLVVHDPWATAAAALHANRKATLPLNHQILNPLAEPFCVAPLSPLQPHCERDARDDLIDSMNNTIMMLTAKLEASLTKQLCPDTFLFSSAVGGVAAEIADVRCQVAKLGASLGTATQQSVEERLPSLLRPHLDCLQESLAVKFAEINDSFNKKLVAIGIAAHDEASKLVSSVSSKTFDKFEVLGVAIRDGCRVEVRALSEKVDSLANHHGSSFVDVPSLPACGVAASGQDTSMNDFLEDHTTPDKVASCSPSPRAELSQPVASVPDSSADCQCCAAPGGDAVELSEGSLVRLAGLSTASLNGRAGTVLSYDETKQ